MFFLFVRLRSFLCASILLLPASSDGTFSTRRQQHPPLLVCIQKHLTLSTRLDSSGCNQPTPLYHGHLYHRRFQVLIPSPHPNYIIFVLVFLRSLTTTPSTLVFFPVDISPHHPHHPSGFICFSDTTCTVFSPFSFSTCSKKPNYATITHYPHSFIFLLWLVFTL